MIFSVLFTILCFANCGVPLTLNFVGEFLCLYGAFERLPAEQIRKLLMWDKLPNPGNAWKFLIPNYINSGWTNYSWVISQKMIEKEMGNRGSKLKDDCKTTPYVKEQRVDGSWQLLSGLDNTFLRFTLMDYESNSPKGLFIEQIVSLINHQIKFLSNLRLPPDLWHMNVIGAAGNQIYILIKYSTTITSRKSIQAFPARGMCPHTHPNSPRGFSHEVKLGYVGPASFPHIMSLRLMGKLFYLIKYFIPSNLNIFIVLLAEGPSLYSISFERRTSHKSLCSVRFLFYSYHSVNEEQFKFIVYAYPFLLQATR